MRLAEMLRRAERLMMAAVYPDGAVCILCGRLSHGELLCGDCRAEMNGNRIGDPICPRCGHIWTWDRCDFCHGETPGRMRSAWRHVYAPRKLVHRLKYENVASAAGLLAEGTADCARKLSLPADTVVTWVPMPRKRRRERGIDHGRLLAQETAKRLGFPCVQLLERSGENHTQHGLSRQQRLGNLSHAFVCPVKISGHVLLVDDVMTTSATVRACAACLMAAGAEGISIVTATQA